MCGCEWLYECFEYWLEVDEFDSWDLNFIFSVGGKFPVPENFLFSGGGFVTCTLPFWRNLYNFVQNLGALCVA